jgi:hypothetical protein
VNLLTAVFLMLAALSLVIPPPIPRIGGHPVCVKAFIVDRMFNKHMMFPEVPRAGDLIDVGNYEKRASLVQWSSSGAIIYLERESNPDTEQQIVDAGFVEYIKAGK